MQSTLVKILKVAAWAGGSAFAVSLVDQLNAVDWNAMLGDNAPYAVAVVNVLVFAIGQYVGRRS